MAYNQHSCPPMPSRKDFDNLTGLRFGRLTVVGFGGVEKNISRWVALCDCGVIIRTAGTQMRRGRTQSCGCLHRELLGNRVRKHSSCSSPTYNSWRAMRARCLNRGSADFASYGGRGIGVCDRWVDSFPNFLADMGERPSLKHTLERKRVNGDYEPDNCRWATRQEQAYNKTNTRYLEYNGESKALAQWAKEVGVPVALVTGRLRLQWCNPCALELPRGGSCSHRNKVSV